MSRRRAGQGLIIALAIVGGGCASSPERVGSVDLARPFARQEAAESAVDAKGSTGSVNERVSPNDAPRCREPADTEDVRAWFERDPWPIDPKSIRFIKRESHVDPSPANWWRPEVY